GRHGRTQAAKPRRRGVGDGAGGAGGGSGRGASSTGGGRSDSHSPGGAALRGERQCFGSARRRGNGSRVRGGAPPTLRLRVAGNGHRSGNGGGRSDQLLPGTGRGTGEAVGGVPPLRRSGRGPSPPCCASSPSPF